MLMNTHLLYPLLIYILQLLFKKCVRLQRRGVNGNIGDYAFQITENTAAEFNAFAHSSRVSTFLHGVNKRREAKRFFHNNVEDSN